jgi:hypothetical protein
MPRSGSPAYAVKVCTFLRWGVGNPRLSPLHGCRDHRFFRETVGELGMPDCGAAKTDFVESEQLTGRQPQPGFPAPRADRLLTPWAAGRMFSAQLFLLTLQFPL